MNPEKSTRSKIMWVIYLVLFAVFLAALVSCDGRLLRNKDGQILSYANEDRPSQWSEQIRHIPAEYDK